MRCEARCQIACRLPKSHSPASRPKIQDVALGLALGMEAAVDTTIQVDRERTMAPAIVGLVDGARPSFLSAEAAISFRVSQSRQDIAHGDLAAQTREVDSRIRGACDGKTRRPIRGLCLSGQTPALAGSFEFLVALPMDQIVDLVESVRRRDVADSSVEADRVVILDIFSDQPLGVGKSQGNARAEALLFETGIPSFFLSVGLGIAGRRSNLVELAHFQERPELSGNKLRSVVGDETRPGVRKGLSPLLDNDLGIEVPHVFPQFPGDDVAAVAFQDAAQMVEDAPDANVAEVDMPVPMRATRLSEPAPFLRWRDELPAEATGGLEDSVDGSWACCHDVGIHHHIGQPPIAFARMFGVVVEDCLSFLAGEPVVSGDPAVVLVDFSVAITPLVELRPGDAEPDNEQGDGNLGFVAPFPYEIDNFVPRVVGNPASFQGSPISFLTGHVPP